MWRAETDWQGERTVDATLATVAVGCLPRDTWGLTDQAAITLLASKVAGLPGRGPACLATEEVCAQ